jgi:hypothetical protein
MTSRSCGGLISVSALVFMVSAGCSNRTAPELTSAEVARTGCTREQRDETLRGWQSHVLDIAPRQIASLDRAIAQGGPLAGWRLSHGYAVVAGSGGVAIDNITAREPTPQVLLYAPAASSAQSDWADFDRPDGPYRLTGWAYLAPFGKDLNPPAKRCIAASEWFVHEAGWHLMDGGMLLTPGATAEPSRPDAGGYFWHPRVWDLHVWLDEDGVPSISYANPSGHEGGVVLPEGAFLRVAGDRLQPIRAH